VREGRSWRGDRSLWAKDQALLASYEAILGPAERRAGPALSCRVGCTDCCVGVFEITALDACRLVRGLDDLRRTAPPTAEGVRVRAEAQWRALAEQFPGDPLIGRLKAGEASREALFARFDAVLCPVLDPGSGACLLYHQRPLSCRSFGLPVRCAQGVLAPCPLNFRTATAAETEACIVDLDPQDLEGDLLLALARRGVRGDTVIAAALALSGWSNAAG
jgi:Fe-S-cluster containining protein